MQSVSSAINALRMKLISQSDYDNYFLIDKLCDEAATEIDYKIAQIIEQNVTEVISYAESLGLSEFDEEIKVISYDNDVYITTKSGTLDFSKPEKKMLPYLLQNAEVSPSTGNKRKVIPVQKKKKRKFKSLMDVMKDAAHEKPIGYSGPHTSPVNNTSSNMANKINSFNSNTTEEKEGPVNFRTASSTQDPNKSWVIPPKEADLSLTISIANQRISAEIDEAIFGTIKKYEEEIWAMY